MSSYEREIKYPAVYEARTTYAESYKKFEDVKRQTNISTRDRCEPPPQIKPPPKVRDNETMCYFREESHIPFNILWARKPITQTSPLECFVTPERPVDTKKEEVMKTRPRLYMSPAVSMDDVDDPELRKLLLGHMYTTDWRKSELEAAGPVTKRVIPNSALELCNKPVSFYPNVYPPVKKEIKESGRTWDTPQTRTCVDPTRSFWLNKEPRVKCGACENPYKGLVEREVKQKIADLIDNEQLRMPHDKLGASYTGFKPELATGVTLEKQNLSVSHPLVSVAQALETRRQGR